jgi:hypothetical protein
MVIPFSSSFRISDRNWLYLNMASNLPKQGVLNTETWFSSKMVPNTKVIGKLSNFYMISIGLLIPRLDKVKVSRYGPMVPCTRAGGETTNPMVKAASFILKETSTMATGKMTSIMASVFTLI